MRLLRESKWVKVYETKFGVVLDSKYRTFRCDVRGAEFIAEWVNSDQNTRDDMEAAFTFYPLDDAAGLDAILAFVRRSDADRAERMLNDWTTNSRDISDSQNRFLLELRSYLTDQGEPTELIGENRWFTIVGNDAGYTVQSRLTAIEQMPTDAELAELQRNARSPAYVHAIGLVRRCTFLIAPDSAFDDGGL